MFCTGFEVSCWFQVHFVMISAIQIHIAVISYESLILPPSDRVHVGFTEEFVKKSTEFGLNAL